MGPDKWGTNDVYKKNTNFHKEQFVSSMPILPRFSRKNYANNASYLAQRISDLLPHSNCRSVAWVG